MWSVCRSLRETRSTRGTTEELRLCRGLRETRSTRGTAEDLRLCRGLRETRSTTGTTGEFTTVSWPSGNKIHERHDGEIMTVALPEPYSCFNGEREQVTEASDLISDRSATTVCHNTLSTSKSTCKRIPRTPQAVTLCHRDPTRTTIQLRYIGAHKRFLILGIMGPSCTPWFSRTSTKHEIEP